MDKLQWSAFEKKIYIDTSLEKLYQLWATRDGICSWFLKELETNNKNTYISYKIKQN